MPAVQTGRTRAPATRDQVDAYRFGLRRLDAALVRGDPVPLHEQVRSQRRAAIAGVLLGLLALVAVAVYAKVVPRPDWRLQAVVLGAESGALYVVAHDPDRLVPVANLAAGRLVLAALRRGGVSDADPATAVPVPVSDADLDGAPRTATAAVPGAVAVRPGGAVIPPRWAVCDEVGPDGDTLRTTVVGGAELPPAELREPSAAVLLAVPGGSTWLVTDGRRHRVDLDDRAVTATLGIAGRVPRPASAALVSALPEGSPLITPEVPGRGAAGVPGRVGEVVVHRPVGGTPQHFVVLAQGLQQVTPLVAEVLRTASGGGVREVGAEVLAGLETVAPLDVDDWPVAAPQVRDPAEAPVTCWSWDGAGDPAGGAFVGGALPVPAGATPVVLAQADGPAELADAVVLAPASGAAVRATGPGRLAGAGPLWVVSATGVTHGVADQASADALGITAAETAPETALRLLPVGPTLDLGQALRLVDVLPAGG